MVVQPALRRPALQPLAREHDEWPSRGDEPPCSSGQDDWPDWIDSAGLPQFHFGDLGALFCHGAPPLTPLDVGDLGRNNLDHDLVPPQEGQRPWRIIKGEHRIALCRQTGAGDCGDKFPVLDFHSSFAGEA